MYSFMINVERKECLTPSNEVCSFIVSTRKEAPFDSDLMKCAVSSSTLERRDCLTETDVRLM